VHAVAELDQRPVVQQERRDAAAFRLAHDGLRGWPQPRPSSDPEQVVHLLLQVETGLRLDQVVHQAHGQLASGQPDVLVLVAVDDVVAPSLTGRPRLSPADVEAGAYLERESHMLSDVAEPGSALEPFEEAPGMAA